MLSIQTESFMACTEELEVLFNDHYDELALNKDKVPLSPMYDVYQSYEDADKLIFVTCRDEGKLVGYFVGTICPGLHYSTCLTCTMDIFYVVKEYRGTGLGKDLFNYLERELRTRKVQRWFVGSKLHSPIDGFFKQLGFEPIETYHSKWIGE